LCNTLIRDIKDEKLIGGIDMKDDKLKVTISGVDGKKALVI